MKTLQMWFNPDAPPRIKSYMSSVVKHTPECKHYFIGPEVNAVEGQIVLDFQTELDKAYARLGNKEWWDRYNTANKFRADMIRLAWALDHPDLLYVDADIEFVSAPILPTQTDLPVMGQFKNRLVEFALFYVNGCNGWFLHLIDFTIRSPFDPFAFMVTFIDMRRKRCGLNIPFIWKDNTFFRRHE